MKYRFVYLTVALCVASAVIIGSVEAQNKRVGTSAAPELLIPVGARDLAMSGATTANSMGIEAIYWNPAGLGLLGDHSAEAMFSSMSYIADINVYYGAVAAGFGDFGVIGITVKSLAFGDIPLTTQDDPENASGRFYSPTYVTFGLSYARAITDVISVGGTVKLINEEIANVSASGFALDVGVQYNRVVGIDGFALGVAVKNIGPQMKFDGGGMYRVATSSDGRRPEQRYKSEAAEFELPSTVEIGLAYSGMAQDNIMYNVGGSFTNNNLYYDEYRLGGEVGYSTGDLAIFGRLGFQMVPQTEIEDDIFGPTFGAGVHWNAPGIDITVDYAYRSVEYFDGNSILSLKFGF